MRHISPLINAWYYFRVQLQENRLMKPLSILSSTLATGISIAAGFLFLKYSFAGQFDSLIESLGYGNIYGFVVTGSIVIILYQGALNIVAFSLEDERRLGTLELLMAIGHWLPLFAGRLLFGLTRYGIMLAPAIVVAVVFSGSTVGVHVNFASLGFSIFLLIVATLFQGIVAQSIIIQSRKIKPFYFAMLTPLNWFCGSMIPVEIFPYWLHVLTYLSPFTPALKILRRAIFSYGIQTEVDIIMLATQSLIYSMIAIVFSLRFIERALKRGEALARG